MAPQEDHQEPEAHQQHGQDVDRPGIGDGIKDGPGRPVQALGIDGNDLRQAAGYVFVHAGEEGHCHRHGDEQKDDQKPRVSAAFHTLNTSLFKNRTRDRGLIPVPCAFFNLAPFIFFANYFIQKYLWHPAVFCQKQEIRHPWSPSTSWA